MRYNAGSTRGPLRSTSATSWFDNTTFVIDPATGAAAAAPAWKTFINTNADITVPTWANPQPPNGSNTGQQPTFSVDVRDNRPTNLTVSWILDGSTAHTASYPQNLTQHQANQPTTVSWQPPSNLSAGSHTMQVQVTDASSNSVTSSIWSIVVAAAIPPHITTTPFGTCSACHSAAINTEHQNRGYTCDEPCHSGSGSGDQDVIDAINNNDTSCEACHGATPDHSTQHNNIEVDGCSACHSFAGNAFFDNHAGYDCDECHSGPGAINPALDYSCGSCHTPSTTPWSLMLGVVRRSRALGDTGLTPPPHLEAGAWPDDGTKNAEARLGTRRQTHAERRRKRRSV